MPLLAFSGQIPPGPQNINFAVTFPRDLFPQLNAGGPADLVYWDPNVELFGFVDEAAQRLARRCGIFVTRDTSNSGITGFGAYPLPALHVSTIQVDLNGQVLKPLSTPEAEALDASWQTTAASLANPPARFLEDTTGLYNIFIYPLVDAARNGKPVGIVMHSQPPTISNANQMIEAPQVLAEYFTFYALREARKKETKAAMPEVAQFLDGVIGMLEAVAIGYWGESV